VVFNGLWYDGETAGAKGSDGAGYASNGGITEMADGTGYGASTHYLRLTVTAAGSWYASGSWMNESAMPQTRDVSSFSALELWWRIPSGSVPAGNDFRPDIVLVSNSGSSQPVSATSYLDSQTVPGMDTWVHSTIPISAFTGMDLTTIKAITVQPAFGQYSSGSYSGAVDLDNIQFTHASGLPLRDFNGLFADFALYNASYVPGQYWFTAMDSDTCAILTTMSYPTGSNPPVDAGGSTLSPMECGHFTGVLGTSGGACNPFAQMACHLSTANVNLADGSFFKTLPAGATGMRFGLKVGPGSDPSQVYHVVLTLGAVPANSGEDYYVQVAGKDLNSSTFTYYQVAFPANGTAPTKHGYSDTSELWWGQPGWVTAIPWDDTAAGTIQVLPATGGVAFDVMVDDIEFYGGPAPTATITPTYSASPTPQDTATPSASPTLQDTASNTPSVTPQDTASSTPSVTPQDTASSTPSMTPSFTPSPSSTATFSATPSPVVFNGLWYDGETAGAKGSDGAGYASNGGITEMADGTGYGASTHYLRLTVTAAGSWYASGSWMNESAMPQTRDVSSFSALELWWRIPSGSVPAGNDFRPDIVLVSNSGSSQPVSATSYLDSQTVPGMDTWVHSTIPISAFTGMDLTTIKAITVQPAFGQYSSGSYSGAVDLDNIQFTHASGLPLRDFNGLFADFALYNASYVPGQYWFTAMDSDTCAILTTMSYPTGSNPPVDAGGSTLSPMECGHFTGVLGTSGGACNPFAQMACHLSTANVNLADGSFFKTLPAGATGMRFGLKVGPGSDPSQVYHVVLTLGAVPANSGEDYYVQVAGKDLNSSTFTYYQVAFPANGTAPTKHGYSDTSELWWGQPGWVTAIPWDDTAAGTIQVLPATGGVAFDVMVDDIEFY
jgi:hypothetical protein